MLVSNGTNVIAKDVINGELEVEHLPSGVLQEIMDAGAEISNMGKERWSEYLGRETIVAITRGTWCKGTVLRADPNIGLSIFSAYDLSLLIACSDVRDVCDVHANIWRVVVDGEFEDGFVDLVGGVAQTKPVCAFSNPLTVKVMDRPVRTPLPLIN